MNNVRMRITWRKAGIAILLGAAGYFFGPDVASRLETVLIALQGGAI